MAKKHSSEENDLFTALNCAYKKNWSDEDVYNWLLSRTNDPLLIDKIINRWNGGQEQADSSNKRRTGYK